MNFEEAFKHCQDGTATQEERDYIKSQLDAANTFMEDERPNGPTPVKEAEKADVKRAKKKLIKYIIAPICAVFCALVVVGAILGGVFGFASASAKKSAKYDKGACVEIAMNTAFNYMVGILPPTISTNIYEDINSYQVDSVDRHFQYDGTHLDHSYYIYIVEVSIVDNEFEIEVDTRNGNTRIREKDLDSALFR